MNKKIYFTSDVIALVKDEYFEEVRKAFREYAPETDDPKSFIAAIGSMTMLTNTIIRELETAELDANLSGDDK